MGALKAGKSVNEVLQYMSKLPRADSTATAEDTSTPATDSKPADDGSGIVDETNAHAANIVEDLSEKPSFTGALDVFGNIAGEAGDILGSGIKLMAKATTPPPVYNAIASMLQDTVKKIAGTPQAQAITKAWGEFSAQNPNAAKDIGNAINIGALAAGGEVEPEGLASEVGSAVKQGASDAADAVGSGIKSAVKAPINAAENLGTSIPENVKTILTNPTEDTEGTLKDMFSTAKTAVTKTGAETPFDTVGKNRLGGALGDLNDKMSAAMTAKNQALDRVGSRAVDISQPEQAFHNDMEDILGTKMDIQGNLSNATGRESLVMSSPGDAKLLGKINDIFGRLSDSNAGDATVRRVNDSIDSIQKQIFDSKKMGADPIASQTEAVARRAIGRLNATLKDATKEGMDAEGNALNPYADANAEYSKLRPIHDDLSARLGKNMKNAGSMVKRIFSPQDGGTKTLVKALEQETGQPIFHDATLAKFAMDTVGDPRAKSLLDKLQEGGTSLTSRALDYVTKKISNPEGVATRMVKNALKK